MRAFFALSIASALFHVSACGSSSSSAPPRAGGSGGKAVVGAGIGGDASTSDSGRGGSGGASASPGGSSGTHGKPTAGTGTTGGAELGGEAGASGAHITDNAGEAPSAGQGGEAGAPEPQRAGRGGAGGSGGNPDECNCDPAHYCDEGVCEIKPECNCAALGVECSTLKSALGDSSSCPLDIQCGSCDYGDICVRNTNPGMPVQSCVTPTPNVDCSISYLTDPNYRAGFGSPPDCASLGPTDCNAAYLFCGPITLPDGTVCPISGAWYCGPG